MRAQASPEGAGGVPRALAAMEDEAAVIRRALPANRPPDRVDRDLPGDALGHRPARDLAGGRRLSRLRDRAALLLRACRRCRPPKARCARPRRKRALPGSTEGLPARPSSECGAFGSRPFRQVRASAWCGARASRPRRCRFFAARGRCAGSRNGPCAARRPRRRTLRAPLALSGRWISSGRDTRRNRISRLSSARMPS